MIIAIPTIDQKICMHFGHCEQFAMAEVDEEKQSIIHIDYQKPPAHEPGLLPRWLNEKGANLIIAGGIGKHAQTLLAENNIKVIVGAKDGTPEAIVAAYFNQTLTTDKNLCDEHSPAKKCQ
ncbi:NifB/NifX family molybdenum-iron cluster-binding protein [Teredinibacter haidensis]|uniref:NifB/NifX family molybdenum-iron cluster-binding protein n=1 Tax=Teredinibacter haidensis TaxID=2731755 RepID=UPI000948E8CE|nr:NifB/NifX family molybdenum-iron cluster-binding protein [Teredinibacter haidensis]